MSGTDGNHEYPDDRPLSPEPVVSHAREGDHVSIPEYPSPELAMSRESTQAEPENPGKHARSRLHAPSMAFLKPSYWLGTERHEILPEPPHRVASPVTAEPPLRVRKATVARFPFLGLTRSTRVGIALVISFVCLVAGLVSHKAKSLALAMEGPADPLAKDKTPEKDKPATAAPAPVVVAPSPPTAKVEEGTADPAHPPLATAIPPGADDKAKTPSPEQTPSMTTPPVGPPGSDPPNLLEPPTSGLAATPAKNESKPADPLLTGESLDFPSLPSTIAPPRPALKPDPVVTPAPVAPPVTTLPAPVLTASAPPPSQPAIPPATEVAVPIVSPMPLTLEPSPPSNSPAVAPDAMPAAVAGPALTGSGWTQIPSGGKQRVPGGVIDLAPVGSTPLAVVADGPRANDDIAAIDPVESVLYKVKSGENFFTISRLFYRSGRYYKSLHAANARQFPVITDLYVGATIRIPPVEALDRSLVVGPSLVTPALGAEVSPSAVSRTSTRRTEPVDELEQPSNPRNRAAQAEADSRDEPVRPSYTVKPNQTLRSIARDTLGDIDREAEIRVLNRAVLGEARNPTAGMVLILPSDAVVGRRGR